jgi:hypothetical protein
MVLQHAWELKPTIKGWKILRSDVLEDADLKSAC